MDKSVTDVLDRLQSVSSEIELKKAIEWYLAKTDINIYAYIAFLPETGPKGINNHPQSWLDHYREQGYLDLDPVISRARGRLRPFQWSDISRSLDKREKTVMGEGAGAGIVSGATVPVPGPGRAGGMIFFSSDLPNQNFDRLWQDKKYELHMVGLYFHSAFVDLFRKENTAAHHLTSRERECLLWTSRGKTAWEVAEILNISERTVTFHLQNSADKLGCYSKFQAVVKAILLELIAP
ncbi:MAG: LuxR family transcriptional regulator [Alphaproteobacteria bacterium]